LLLRRVIEAAIQGSEPMRELLEDFHQRLVRVAEETRIDWMNPDDPKLDPFRLKATELIQSLQGLDQLRTKILDRRQHIEQSIRRTYQPVGWLRHDRDEWQLKNVAAPSPRELFVAVPVKQAPAQWKKVGVITDGQPNLDQRGGLALRDGRPVFIEVRW
jgi:hypothetical protein